MRSGNGMEPRNRMREAHAMRGTHTRQEEDAYLELRSNETSRIGRSLRRIQPVPLSTAAQSR
jgi:hypothetical protein